MPPNVSVEEGDKSVTVKLLSPGAQSEEELKASFESAKASGKIVIAIDFTHPTAVNRNAELYCKLGIPFVMGTTGGDRDALNKVVKETGLYALIAPNMCKQIVALQATLKTMSETYPGEFGSYVLSVR